MKVYKTVKRVKELGDKEYILFRAIFEKDEGDIRNFSSMVIEKQHFSLYSIDQEFHVEVDDLNIIFFVESSTFPALETYEVFLRGDDKRHDTHKALNNLQHPGAITVNHIGYAIYRFLESAGMFENLTCRCIADQGVPIERTILSITTSTEVEEDT